jgi:hypothetical protein
VEKERWFEVRKVELEFLRIALENISDEDVEIIKHRLKDLGYTDYENIDIEKLEEILLDEIMRCN